MKVNVPRMPSPDKQKSRAREIFNSIIKQAVKESIRRPGHERLRENDIRNEFRNNRRRSKIAERRGIKIGSPRWDALVKNTRAKEAEFPLRQRKRR